jgi:hypothetical protein
MPRNVASPEQAASAREQVRNIPSQNKFSRTRPMTRSERELMRVPVDAVYIYNLSPIWKWQKDFPGLGSISIFATPWRTASQFSSVPKVYSDAIALERRMVRTYDGGNRILKQMTENPIEIAEDVLCCSTEFPGRPENNLTLYGCFYTIGKPIEEFSPKERQEILDDAEFKHINKCHEFVAQGDALADGIFKPVEVHKRCALFLGEERDWVARRGKLTATDECPFCGYDNKRGVSKCRNCHEVIDPVKYAEQQAALKGKKAS